MAEICRHRLLDLSLCWDFTCFISRALGDFVNEWKQHDTVKTVCMLVVYWNVHIKEKYRNYIASKHPFYTQDKAHTYSSIHRTNNK